MKTHVYVSGKRKQVSIEENMILKINQRGYTLDSFLQQELEAIDISQFSSKEIQYLARKKLEDTNVTEQINKEEYIFTFVDLFAGIGGFRLALERQKGKCLGYSEIQWDSMRVYTKNFQIDEIYLGDIRDIGLLDFNVDLIVGGVPCQSWSSAGKNLGFDDERGRLWLDTLRVVKENQPKCFLFENVKGLADPRHVEALKHIQSAFEALGYSITHKVLSSRDFGLVQDRERIFLVGFRESIYMDKFQWPKAISIYPPLGEVIKIPNFVVKNKSQSCSVQLCMFSPNTTVNFASHNDKFNDYFIFSDVRTGDTTIHSWDFIDLSVAEKQLCERFPSLRRRVGKKQYNRDGAPLSLKDIIQNDPNLANISEKELNSLVDKGIFKKIYLEENEVRYDFINSKQSTGINGVYRVYSTDSISFPTLTATGSPDFISLLPFQGNTQKEYNQYFVNEIFKENQFRHLSDREVARLQGFPDNFQLCSQGNAKRQLGNAVSVPVIEQLVQSIKKTGVFGENL